MITLQWFNGKKWEYVGEYVNEMTLGEDNYIYRTIDERGNILHENTAPNNPMNIKVTREGRNEF